LKALLVNIAQIAERLKIVVSGEKLGRANSKV
jgi:hypothetical protein